MAAYREAKALQTLHAELNDLAPERSIASDGWIGDADHAARDSDHNPWVKDSRGIGVVRARDFTHDPAGGLDCDWLAAHLASLLGVHPAMGAGAYVIWEDRIISANRLSERWRPYSGSNEHRKHCHVSVGLTGYDNTTPWLEDDDMANSDEILSELRATRAELGRLDAKVESMRRAIVKRDNAASEVRKDIQEKVSD